MENDAAWGSWQAPVREIQCRMSTPFENKPLACYWVLWEQNGWPCETKSPCILIAHCELGPDRNTT